MEIPLEHRFRIDDLRLAHSYLSERFPVDGFTWRMARKSKFDKSRIDWRKPNCVIAEQFGVSNEAVRLWRLQAKAPRPLFQMALSRARRYAKVLDRIEEIRGLPKKTAEQILGFRLDRIRLLAFARRHAQLTMGRTPWNKVNFKLPSGVLARIWRVRIQDVHTERERHHRGEPKWRATRNRTLLTNKSFVAAMQSEERKADRFFGGCWGTG